MISVYSLVIPKIYTGTKSKVRLPLVVKSEKSLIEFNPDIQLIRVLNLMTKGL